MTSPLWTSATNYGLTAWSAIAGVLASLLEDIDLLDSHRAWRLSAERRESP
ncbi:MAG: hypothetical protein OXN89_11375 [Bryobacterales bacterium]|nr:hypothetical protein [Bryobacterales bacterium]